MERRKFLRRAAVGLTTTLTVPSIASADPDVGTDDVVGPGTGGGSAESTVGEHQYTMTDTLNGHDFGTLEIGSGITQYAASSAGQSRQYWRITFETVTNAYTHNGSELYSGLQGSRSALYSDFSKWTVNNNKYWVGGGTSESPVYDEYSWAEESAILLVGLMPYVGAVLTAAELLSYLHNAFDDGPSGVYEHNFLWGPDYGLPQDRDAKQGEIFNRFDAECDPYETFSFALDESATGFDNNYFQKYNTFEGHFAAPSYSPSEASLMTPEEQEEQGIVTVQGKELKEKSTRKGRNTNMPQGMEIAGKKVSELDDDEEIIFAPINADVKTSSTVIRAETLDILLEKQEMIAEKREEQF